MAEQIDYKGEFDKAMKRLEKARGAILKAVTPGDLRALELEARSAMLDMRFRSVNLERWIREAVGIRTRELNDRASARAQDIIDRIKKQEPEAKLALEQAKEPVVEEKLEEDELRPDVIGDAVEEPVETPVETPISAPVEEPIGDAVGEPVEEPVEEPKPKRKTSSKRSSKKES